jgi:AraC-like DNA-binding protein
MPFSIALHDRGRRPSLPETAAIASAALPYLFSRFRVSASIVETRPAGRWHPLYYQPDRPERIDWELRFGREMARRSHNAACLRRVSETRTACLADLDGYWDLYFPILRRRTVVACVVCGPFLREPLTAARIRAEWERLSGRSAYTNDPELASYCATALRAPLLDERAVAGLRLLVRTIVGVASKKREPRAVLDGLPRLADRLTAAYPSTLTWIVAEGLVNPDLSPVWRAEVRREMLSSVGVRHLPTSVILALPVIADDDERDMVARAVVIARLQRACVALSRSIPEALAGRVASEGFFLLLRTDAARASERRAVLRTAADRLVALAREHGARVRMGASAGVGDPEQLPQRFQEALVAAQQATYAGRELVVHGEVRHLEQGPVAPTWHDQLTEIQRALLLGHVSTARLNIDSAVSGILVRSSGSAQSARAYLDAAFLDTIAALRGRASVDDSVLDAVRSDFAAALERAPSAVAAASAFRDAYQALIAAVERPSEQTSVHRIGRAVRLLARAFAEPLTLARVARHAGLSPAYFSRLFKRLQGKTFERYLLEYRLERAKELLRTTELPVQRVARQSGFNSYVYFATAFRRHVGRSATSYRDNVRTER